MKYVLPNLLLMALAFDVPARADENLPVCNEVDKPRLVEIKYQAFARYVAAGQEDERAACTGQSLDSGH